MPDVSDLPTVIHTGGVPWHDAPLPRRWHRCRAHSYGWVKWDYIERCRCGAVKVLGLTPFWVRRNSRRRWELCQTTRRPGGF